MPVLPAVITRDVGVTDKLNSELPEVPGPELETSRRGDMEQPVEAMIVKAKITASSTLLKRIGNGGSSLSSLRWLAQAADT